MPKGTSFINYMNYFKQMSVKSSGGFSGRPPYNLLKFIILFWQQKNFNLQNSRLAMLVHTAVATYHLVIKHPVIAKKNANQICQ